LKSQNKMFNLRAIQRLAGFKWTSICNIRSL